MMFTNPKQTSLVCGKGQVSIEAIRIPIFATKLEVEEVYWDLETQKVKKIKIKNKKKEKEGRKLQV